MNEQEQKDLAELASVSRELKIRLFDYLVHLDRYNEKELEMSGYRNGNAEAMRKAFQNTQRDIKKLIDNHLKKYPD